MSDLIDRQALLKQIDIDSDGEPGYYGDTWKFIDTIKNMPNAHDLPKDADTISRQAAIDALRKMQTYKLFSGDDMLLIDQAGAQTELMLLPSRTPMQELLDVTADRDYWKAQCHSYEMTINRLTESVQPERKRGKWETAYLDHVSMGIRPKVLYCSECNQCIAYPTNYCPNCGTDMRGEKDG